MHYSQYPTELIHEMQRLRKQLVKIASAKAPCPSCGFSCNHFEAAKTKPEDFEFAEPPPMKCPNCDQAIAPQVSLLGSQRPYRWIMTGRRRRGRKRS